MRRYASLAAAALVGLFVSGCSASHEASAPVETRTSAKPSVRPSVKESSFDLPENAEVLVAETSGTSDKDLKEFKPGKGVYTIYSRCSGKGKVTIVDRDDDKDGTTLVRCDGVVSVGRVYVDIETQRLQIRVAGDPTNWTVAVVAGEHDV
ncbi:hypothetical protein [Streptomyces sp. NPDC001914]|uniref:hypothetical protein n=1 Tax=Streptomyces sp. NPDC001914 TaxID=3364623 RepID=UPI0036CDA586